MIPNIDDETELQRYLAERKQAYMIIDGNEFKRLKEEKPLMQLVILKDHFLKMKRLIALITNTVNK
jgi:hypothetical protein